MIAKQTLKRSRVTLAVPAHAAAIAALLCLAVGCEGEFGEPDEQTKEEYKECGLKKPAPGLTAPPGSYVDQGLTIDYPRIAGDKAYYDQIADDPRGLEQVYADAVGDNESARWTVCLIEAASRGAGRRSAELLASLRCQTFAPCSFDPGDLKYSATTASGVRVLNIIADSFEAKARSLQLTQEIIGHGLTVFVGTRIVAMRLKATSAAVTISRPTMPRPARAGPAPTVSRPTVSRPQGKPRTSSPRMRELTDAELTQVRGGSAKTPRPGAAAAGRAAAAPTYRPFTRGNFRHNLAQRTGGIPTDAQAHHVLPVKFEGKFSKAGINIHKPRYGTWWQRREHQRKARAYNARWKEFFGTSSNPSRQEILQFGREVAKEFGLAIGF